MNGFIDFLKAKLSMSLQGAEYHKILAPKFKGMPFRKSSPNKDAKESSVLILLQPDYSDGFNILFTLRSANLFKHSGQICFPGGRIEMNETAEDAAKRETEEEIGISQIDYQIIGSLSQLYVPPSNNIINPFVAVLINNPDFEINPDEVEEIFSVNIKDLNLDNTIKYHTDYYDEMEVLIPYFDVHKSTKLWGATSMILAEFIFLYEEFLKLENK